MIGIELCGRCDSKVANDKILCTSEIAIKDFACSATQNSKCNKINISSF